MDRIERALDGELGRDELSAEERAELERLEASLAGVRRALAGLEAPDVSTAVLWRIRQLKPVPGWLPGPLTGAWLALRRAGEWLWAPRAVRLRPGFALGALALVLALPMAARELGRAPDEAGQPEPLLVQFRLGAEGARQVELAGDFTDWRNRYQLDEIAPGVWSIVIPLEPGVYDYQFVIDGERWMIDPLAPTVADGFGGSNSQIAVMTAEEERTL